MKKLIGLFTILAAIVATVCSVGLSSASAAEEEPETVLDGDVINDNLFQGYYYGYGVQDEKTGLSGFVTSGTQEYNYTNIIKAEPTKKVIISLKYTLSNSSIDMNNLVSMENSGLFILDNNLNRKEFIRNETGRFNEYVKYSYYSLDASGSELTVNLLLKNPEIALSKKGTCYFAVSPVLMYFDANGDAVIDYTSRIKETYISFIQDDEFITSNEDLSNLEFDYTPKTSTVQWSINGEKIESNYGKYIFSQDKDVSNFMNLVSAKNPDGNAMEISYRSFELEEMFQTGKIYDYIVRAKDTAGNYDFYIVSLNFADVTAPVISGSTSYTIPSGSTISMESIKQTLIVTDNVDDSENITITLKYDYYSDNRSKPGTYVVCFVATDKAGNISEDFIIRITVADKTAPKFYDEYGVVVTKATVYKSPDSVLVLSDILDGIKAVDDIDGEREITVHSDKYTGNGEIVGTYLVVLKAKDKSGNVAYYNVNIIVDELMPSKTILINEKIILVEKNNKLSKDDFHNIIKMLGTYNPNTTSYTSINSDMYSASYNTNGEYIVEYSIISTAGYEVDGIFITKVIDSRTANSFKDDAEEPDGFIESILKWIWNLIVTFFEWIGSLFTGGKK